MTEAIEPMATQIDQQQLAQELVERARADGVELVGPGGSCIERSVHFELVSSGRSEARRQAQTPALLL